MDNTDKEERLVKAKNTVFRLLKSRIQSEHEIQEKLNAKNLPVPVIKQTIRYFRDLGLINDRQFAKEWVSSRLKKPFGIDRIRLELKRKGIDPAVIETAIRDSTDQYDEYAVVSRLARYRSSKYKNTDPEKIRQRVYGFLLRRGFSMSVIIKVVRDL